MDSQCHKNKKQNKTKKNIKKDLFMYIYEIYHQVTPF